ncbi:MAG: 2-C-methyl-D-erythritol 4-phosphate cytidylyltransferase [Armatimonadetes bacterium]|nr:2-C-methyl-D-erythritol 4-phosphate cytidylyltransferase [Armatimonadota bacterium]
MSGTSAVIPAAGKGRRFGEQRNKVFASAGGKPVIAHTLIAFQVCPLVEEIVLVVAEHEIDTARQIASEYEIGKLSAVVAGGDHRQDSVARGLQAVSASSEIVAIHDGARPLLTRETIESSIAAAREHGAAVAAVPVIDTIKSATQDNFVASTLDRSSLWSIQTPQTFEKGLILRAYEEAASDGSYATDDAALVERIGHPVKLIMGSYDNIKVTTPLDLEFVEARLGGVAAMKTRTGFGYDIHRFAEGRRLFLGGVEFSGEVGLEGHSDADVILHAIADALLGAASLGDIGRRFPNTDPRYRNASSIVLLEKTAEILSQSGWEAVNVDATLVAERPRIADHVVEMQERTARALGIEPDIVSIKATTAEKLGDVGAGKGAECYAVAVVRMV